jgi:hypothetical protein
MKFTKEIQGLNKMLQVKMTEDKLALTTMQASVLEKLGKGHENAMLLSDLVKRTAISERKLRMVIESLRHERYLILINGKKPFGYFICQTWQEYLDFKAYFTSRIIDECLILRDIKLGAKQKFSHEYGQLKLI